MPKAYIISVINKPLNELKASELAHIPKRVVEWQNGSALLKKENINPQIIPLSLPHIALIERTPSTGNENEKRLLIRLAGEEIINRNLGFVVNNYIEDITPDFYQESLCEHYNTVLDEGTMVAQDIIWDYDYKKLHIERLLVPFTYKDSEVANGLMVFTMRDDDTKSYMRLPRTFLAIE